MSTESVTRRLAPASERDVPVDNLSRTVHPEAIDLSVVTVIIPALNEAQSLPFPPRQKSSCELQ